MSVVRRDLFAMEESAALLGAERLGNLLGALGLPGGTVAPEALGPAYKALLAELTLLADLLPTPPQPRNTIDAGTEAAAENGPTGTGAGPRI